MSLCLLSQGKKPLSFDPVVVGDDGRWRGWPWCSAAWNGFASLRRFWVWVCFCAVLALDWTCFCDFVADSIWVLKRRHLLVWVLKVLLRDVRIGRSILNLLMTLSVSEVLSGFRKAWIVSVFAYLNLICLLPLKRRSLSCECCVSRCQSRACVWMILNRVTTPVILVPWRVFSILSPWKT